jgi:formate dehydrogenase iron-sulfur subunit
MSAKAFLVDTTKCSGCRACQVSCKQWNNLPGEHTAFFAGPEYTNPKELSAITFNHVKFFPIDRTYPEKPLWMIMHKKCYHCEDANCMKVCPQEAIGKVEGWTVIDQRKCIGCGACVNSCIYKVPQVLGEDMKKYGAEGFIKKDKAYKCHACMQNKRNVPLCAQHCPTGALSYGDRDELLNKAKARVKQVSAQYPHANLYGEDQFGGLRVLTVLKDHSEKYDLPRQPIPLDNEKAAAIRDTYQLLALFTMGFPSLKRIAYKISRSMQA